MSAQIKVPAIISIDIVLHYMLRTIKQCNDIGLIAHAGIDAQYNNVYDIVGCKPNTLIAIGVQLEKLYNIKKIN